LRTVEYGFTDEMQRKFQLDKNDSYFNAGVLLMNLYAMRVDDLGDEMLQVILENANIIKYADQDVFNAFWGKKIKYISNRYNYIINNGSKYLFATDLSPVIYHFAGPIKPSNYKFSQKYFNKYWEYEDVKGITKFIFMLRHYLHLFLISIRNIFSRK
jgi:lipopolysaccharide biosynthesis glycosyltransferase